jgi:hypothetical protein
MSVRLRTWKNRDGAGSAWIVDYADNYGARRLKTFNNKPEADAFNTAMIAQAKHYRRNPLLPAIEALEKELARLDRDRAEVLRALDALKAKV